VVDKGDGCRVGVSQSKLLGYDAFMRNISILAGLVGACLLSSCTTVKPVVGPDGTENQLIKACGPIEKCYELARETCGGNYTIVNSTVEDPKYGTYVFLVKCAPKEAPRH
jgi:hypothetical protein